MLIFAGFIWLLVFALAGVFAKDRHVRVYTTDHKIAPKKHGQMRPGSKLPFNKD